MFCFFGDLFLEFDDLFIVGMAAFALGHICFIRFFISRGAIGQLKRKPWILAVYVVAGIAMIAYGWSGLEDGLKPVVPIYAALLRRHRSDLAGHRHPRRHRRCCCS